MKLEKRDHNLRETYVVPDHKNAKHSKMFLRTDMEWVDPYGEEDDTEQDN